MWCVWRGLARGKTPAVCRFQDISVCSDHNASVCAGKHARHVEHMRAFCRYTRKAEPSHGDVLNLHTEGLSLLSFSLSLVLSSLSSFVLFSFTFSTLFSLVFSLSNSDNDHSSSRLSLCTHGSNLPECQSSWTLAHSLFGRTCSYHARNNCPGMTLQASCHLE